LNPKLQQVIQSIKRLGL